MADLVQHASPFHLFPRAGDGGNGVFPRGQRPHPAVYVAQDLGDPARSFRQTPRAVLKSSLPLASLAAPSNSRQVASGCIHIPALNQRELSTAGAYSGRQLRRVIRRRLGTGTGSSEPIRTGNGTGFCIIPTRTPNNDISTFENRFATSISHLGADETLVAIRKWTLSGGALQGTLPPAGGTDTVWLAGMRSALACETS